LALELSERVGALAGVAHIRDGSVQFAVSSSGRVLDLHLEDNACHLDRSRVAGERIQRRAERLQPAEQLHICTEIGVLRRERFAGLGALPYVQAKVAVLLPLLEAVDMLFWVVLRALGRLPATTVRCSSRCYSPRRQRLGSAC
jgi:hypothetical protein